MLMRPQPTRAGPTGHNSSLAALLLLLGAMLAPPSVQAQPQGEDWTVCATEGQTCRTGGGETMVRFGADGRYAFRVTRESQPCTIEAFGSDPAPGVTKRCEVSANWRQQPRYRGWQGAGSGNGDWILCANEGDYCRVPGPTQVRYGADGRYAERSTSQGIACHNGVFGDPAQGTAKQCEYRRLSGPGGGGSSSGLPWSSCAREGGSCSFRGPGMLRYGAGGRYIYREAVNGLSCSNDAFGGDPAPGAEKRCELLRLR